MLKIVKHTNGDILLQDSKSKKFFSWRQPSEPFALETMANLQDSWDRIEGEYEMDLRINFVDSADNTVMRKR